MTASIIDVRVRSWVTTNRVPLQSLGRCKFCKSMIGAPIFSAGRFGPGTANRF